MNLTVREYNNIIREFIDMLEYKIIEIENSEKKEEYLPGDVVYIEIEIWRKK